YPIHGYDFSGPGWLQNEHFDFSARIPAGATREEFQKMLQNLMAERFKLAVHREIRPMQVYELTVAKNGAKLKKGTPKDPPGPGQCRAIATRPQAGTKTRTVGSAGGGPYRKDSDRELALVFLRSLRLRDLARDWFHPTARTGTPRTPVAHCYPGSPPPPAAD